VRSDPLIKSHVRTQNIVCKSVQVKINGEIKASEKHLSPTPPLNFLGICNFDCLSKLSISESKRWIFLNERNFSCPNINWYKSWITETALKTHLYASEWYLLKKVKTKIIQHRLKKVYKSKETEFSRKEFSKREFCYDLKEVNFFRSGYGIKNNLLNFILF